MSDAFSLDGMAVIEMHQYELKARCVSLRMVVGLVVLATVSAGYVTLEPRGVFDGVLWSSDPLVSSAENSLRRGELLNALTFANRAVHCDPDSDLTYYIRAAVREARGEFQESLQDYTKAASLGYHFALADRGRNYEKLGQFDKAAASYCEVLRKNGLLTRICG